MAMRSTVAILFTTALLLESGAAARSNGKLREYRHQMVNRGAFVGSAGHAVFGQIRNSPHEWGHGPEGFAKRFGSALGQHAVKQTIQFGVATAHHENLHYQRSNLHGT